MNFAQFIKDNLVGGYQSGTWSEFQVNIFAMNYFMRGNITQEDFDEIQTVLYPEEVEAILNDYMAELAPKTKTYELSKSLSTGASYTVSVDQEPVKPLEVWLGNTYYGDLADDLTVTPTAPHETLTLVSFYNPVIQTVMLNPGTLPTAYSRAPEDIEADIAAAQAKADESIQRVISIEEGQLVFDERVEDAEGNIQNFTAITEMIKGQLITKVEDEALETAKQLWQDGLLEKADQAQFDLLEEGWVEQVNGLREWGANFEALEERTENGETFYVEVQRRFRWDENWITIGKEGSSKQVQITDEQLNIMDGGEATAYFAGQQMYIENATVNQDMTVGNHVTSKYGTSGEITVERWNG